MIDLIIFISAILLGVFIYWRESRSNGIFRAYNAFINKKETRMDAQDKKGFFYKRTLIYRALNALLLAILFGMLFYNIPLLDKYALEATAAILIGLVAGTYLAAALPAAKKAVDNPLDALQEVGQKGKEIVNDLTEAAEEKLTDKKDKEIKEPIQEQPTPEVEKPKESARDRMKRKGYLK